MRHAGYLMLTGDTLIERDTYHCCHCQKAVVVEPGSGKRRGYCFRCNEPTCGGKHCIEGCLPFERALELTEQRARLHKEFDRAW